MGMIDHAEEHLRQVIQTVLSTIYQFLQAILSRVLSPTPPPPGAKLHRPRVAIIGAGLTGVSAAAHCVGHGFEAHIFEAGNRKSLGGIWARVNNTCKFGLAILR